MQDTLVEKARSSREFAVARRLHLIEEEMKIAHAPSMAEKARQGRLVALARRGRGAQIIRFDLNPAMLAMPKTQVMPKFRHMSPFTPMQTYQPSAS